MSNSVPGVGTEAPDFTLKSTAGPVTLSALRGKPVLLAFFPLAFTSTCTQELCDMRDEWDQFQQAGVAVFPISVDSVDTLKEYKWKYDFESEFAIGLQARRLATVRRAPRGSLLLQSGVLPHRPRRHHPVGARGGEPEPEAHERRDLRADQPSCRRQPQPVGCRLSCCHAVC